MTVRGYDLYRYDRCLDYDTGGSLFSPIRHQLAPTVLARIPVYR